MASRKDHITLNFSEAFLYRLRKYAEAHDMKINAVLKRAFELMEVQQAPVQQEKTDDAW